MTLFSANGMNPWRDIWLHPRKTMRSILETDQRGTILLLSFVNGCVGGLAAITYFLKVYPFYEPMQKLSFVVFLFIATLFSSFFVLYVGAFLFRITGSWLKGQGSYSEVKCAIGWSYYPSSVAAVVHILNYITKNSFINFIFTFISLVAFIYIFIIFLKLVAEAHRFSAWRALCAYLIIISIIFVLWMLIIWII